MGIHRSLSMVYLRLVVRILSSYNDECYDNGDTNMGPKRTINRKEEEKLNDKKTFVRP